MSALEVTIEEIRQDISTFADPSSVVEVTNSGDLIWTQSRQRRSARLVKTTTGFPDVSFDGKVYSYVSFLSSAGLADLPDLAQAILSQTKTPDNYLPMQARMARMDDVVAPLADAVDLICSEATDLTRRPLSSTRVLFVYGNAGVGKTSTLRALTRRQAELYLRGQTQTLFLYLDAQGKGLNQLEDVMARALQDLRAKFTYHSVSALARRECIVPIVDGFDELIGPSNAREAFSNLASFLAQLDRQGALITSSRSAFFDYRTLFERAAEVAAARGLSYEVDPLELCPWNTETANKYCSLRLASMPDLLLRSQQLLQLPATEAITHKPFYLVQVCDMLVSGADIDESADLGRQVIDAALRRETTKLRNVRDEPLLDESGHRMFCQQLAEEMWCEERADLDIETIRVLAELFAEEKGLSNKDIKTFVDRSIAHGLLVNVPGQDRRAFEHELFRFEFQADRLAFILTSSLVEARDYICRAEIPAEAVIRLSYVRKWDSQAIADAVTLLQEILKTSRRNEFAHANAGMIAAALVSGRRDLPESLSFRRMIFRSHSFGGALLRHADFGETWLERANLSGTKLHECQLAGALFTRCIISKDTELNGTVVEPSSWPGLVEEDHEGKEHFDPDEIAAILRAHGAIAPAAKQACGKGPSDKAVLAAQLATQFLIRARTRYYFSSSDQWVRGHLISSDLWPIVKEAFRRHNLLEDCKLSKSGPSEIFFRLTIPPDLVLDARTDQAKHREAFAFWTEILAM